MKLLLDTQVFIWLDLQSHRLSTTAQALLRDRNNELYLSLASLWEMQIKYQIGKLQFLHGLEASLQRQQDRNNLQLLLITPEHIFTLGALPDLHRDPFDRLLIAQASLTGYTLLTSDAAVRQYPITTLW